MKTKLPEWFDVPTVIRNRNRYLEPPFVSWTTSTVYSEERIEEHQARWNIWKDFIAKWTR